MEAVIEPPTITTPPARHRPRPARAPRLGRPAVRRPTSRFIETWSSPPRVGGSLAQLTLLGTDWLSLLRTDPGLPAAHLGPDWPAAASTATYRRVFDGLRARRPGRAGTEPAHHRAASRSAGGGPDPGEHVAQPVALRVRRAGPAASRRRRRRPSRRPRGPGGPPASGPPAGCAGPPPAACRSTSPAAASSSTSRTTWDGSSPSTVASSR